MASMEQSAAGRIALVTGGNRGMGFETCRQLAGRGARVVLTSRDPPKGAAAAGRLREEGLDVRHLQLDVAEDDGIARLVEFIRSEFGHLDILINNAGMVRGKDEPRERAMRALEATPAGLRAVLATNLIGPLVLCQALIPLMRGRRRVVNVLLRYGTALRHGRQLSGVPDLQGRPECADQDLRERTRGHGGQGQRGVPGLGAHRHGWVRRGALGRGGRRDHDLLATLPDDGPSGGLFRDRKPIPW